MLAYMGEVACCDDGAWQGGSFFMRMMLVAGILGLVLAGCQPKPVVYDVPGSRSFSEDVDVVWSRLLGFAQRNGFELVEVDRARGSIVAIREDYQDQGWAACKTARVVDRDDDKSRRGRGRPVSRDAGLEITVDDGVDGTVVAPRARFTEEQINPFRNLPFTTGCRSKGTLEKSLLDDLAEAR